MIVRRLLLRLLGVSLVLSILSGPLLVSARGAFALGAETSSPGDCDAQVTPCRTIRNTVDNDVALASATPGSDRRPQLRASVPSAGSDGGTCLVRTGDVDFSSVQQAVDAAASTAIIRIAAGTCYENVSIGKTVTLQGGWSRDFSVRYDNPAMYTTIDGGGAGRVIYMGTSSEQKISPVIDGLTLTGGDATGLGGGIPAFNTDIGGGLYGDRGADATVRDCIIRGNVASTTRVGWGGGIGFYLSDVLLERNLVTGNVASEAASGNGGGIAIRAGSVTMITNTVTLNIASAAGSALGGGIWVSSVSSDLQDNLMLGNIASMVARGDGGGIYADAVQSFTMTGDTVIGNVASVGGDGYGGGVSADMGKLLLVGVVLENNSAATSGGGFYVDDSSEFRMTAGKVVSNSAGMGGGFYLTGVSAPIVSGSVISGNVAGAAGGAAVVGGAGVLFEDTQVLSNLSASYAGGLWLSDCDDATLNRNRFAGNVAAQEGSGILLQQSDAAWLENNVIAGNHAGTGGEGVGIRLDESAARMVHTTLTQNSGGDGSGIYVGPVSSVWMTNTIVVSHTVGITVAGGSSVSAMTTLWGDDEWANVTDWDGAGAVVATVDIVGSPGFVNPSGGEYRIAGGAAVDAAVYAGVDDDINGNARPIGDGYDVGAYEAYLRMWMPAVFKGF